MRTADWQDAFLDQPLAKRIAYIESVREKSEHEKSTKSMEIMDVNQEAVASLLKENGHPSMLIHGHTHRPKHHLHTVNTHRCERWVLGDWYDHGSYLRMDNAGFHACKL